MFCGKKQFPIEFRGMARRFYITSLVYFGIFSVTSRKKIGWWISVDVTKQ